MSGMEIFLVENFFHEPIDLHRSVKTTETRIDQVELIVSERSLKETTSLPV